MVALVGIILTLVTWLAARRVDGLPRWVRIVALVTRARHDRPDPARRRHRPARPPPRRRDVALPARPPRRRPAPSSSRSRAGAATAGLAPRGRPVVAPEGRLRSASRPAPLLVVTGTVSTASGPHSGGEDIRRLGLAVHDTVYVHVRATAVFGIGLLVVGVFLWRLRSELPGNRAWRSAPARRAARARWPSGEIQYRNALPWWLVAIHVSLAATIWVLTVGIAWALHRPPAPLVGGRPPLSSADGERAQDRRATDAAPPRPDRGVPRLERRRSGGDARRRARSCAPGMRGAFAEIDPEGFVDFQATRPTVTLDEGLTRQIEWPENAFHVAAIPGADRDAVILLGVEPNYRWRAFNELVVGLARDLGVELVVTLGALLADVPHTRAAPVTGAASDLSLVEELGLQPSRYEGPTGIVGVLHDACRQAGIPVGEPLVGGAALRLARPEPAGREGALRSPRRAPRDRRSTSRSSRRPRRSTRSRSPRRSPRIPRRPRTSRSSSGGPTRSTSCSTRTTSRPASRSPPS